MVVGWLVDGESGDHARAGAQLPGQFGIAGGEEVAAVCVMAGMAHAVCLIYAAIGSNFSGFFRMTNRVPDSSACQMSDDRRDDSFRDGICKAQNRPFPLARPH